MRFAVTRTGAPVRLTDAQFYLVVLAVAAAITAAVIAAFALLLHRNFLTIACDSAVLESGLVNTMHGHWFRVTAYYGPNILAYHTTFLLLLVIPFYAVAPYPETFFVLQAVGTYSAVIPLYLVGKELAGRPLVAFVLAGLALASPILLHMALAPFHLETWIVAAVLWSYYFYLRNSLAGFLIALFVAVSCGEQAAMIYVALGLSLVLADDGRAWRKRYGLLALVIGLAWLILAIVVLPPIFRGASNFTNFGYHYAQWNIKSPAQLLGALVRSPHMTLVTFFSPLRWVHLGMLVGVPLLFAFFSWRSLWLLASAPVYLLMADQEFYLYFHAYYYAFAFIAGYIGLFIFLGRREPGSRAEFLVLSATGLVNMIMLCCALVFYFQLAGGVDEPFSRDLRETFAKIPPDATVYGPHRFSVYLSARDNMVLGDLPGENVDFNAMVDARYNDTNIHSNQVDYIVSDLMADQCGWRSAYANPEQFKVRSDAVDRLVASGQWEKAWQENNVVILRRVKN